MTKSMEQLPYKERSSRAGLWTDKETTRGEDMEKSRGLKHDSVKMKNMECSMELHAYTTIFYNAETRERSPKSQSFLSQLRDTVTGCKQFQITFKMHN